MANIGNSFHNKIFGVRCDGRPGIAYLRHTDFDGLKMQPFSFQNREGNTLRGGLYSYENHDKQPLVVFFHGMGGGYLAYMAEIEYLCRSGYRVISYDYTGTLSSDGDALGGFCQSLSDGDDALTHIKNNFPGESIYVMGHSWGGYTAGCMVNLHPDIQKAVLLAPPVSMSALYLQMSPVKMIANAMIELEKNKYPAYWEQSVLKDFSQNSKTAVMVIQSRDDKVISYDKHFALLQKEEALSNVQFITVENKNHNPTYTEDAVAYMEEYLKKLNKAKSDAQVKALEKTAQWRKMCELDRNVMDQILAFLEA